MAALTAVSREVPVYPPTRTEKGGTSQLKADIVIEHGTPNHREFFIIELKCEGLYNRPAFVRAVQGDVAKLDGDIQNNFKPAKLWAFAISTSQETYDHMLGWRPDAEKVFLEPDEDVMVLYDRPKIVLWILEKEVTR